MLILDTRNNAFEDSEWKAINQRIDAFYVVEGIPESVCHALIPSLVPDGISASRPWVYARAEHLLELRDFIKKHPLMPTQRIVAWASTVQQKEEETIRLLEEKKERKKRRRTKEGGEGSNPPTDKPPEQEAETPDPETSVLVIPRMVVEGFSMEDLLKSSPLAESKIVRSTSSKLNRILTEACWPCSSSLV